MSVGPPEDTGVRHSAVLPLVLLAASVSGEARQWAAATALALTLLWWLTRNLHGWLVIGLCVGGAAAAAWYLPGELLALGMAGFGGLFLAGALRDLMSERRYRRAGAMDSDAAELGGRRQAPARVLVEPSAGSSSRAGGSPGGRSQPRSPRAERAPPPAASG